MSKKVTWTPYDFKIDWRNMEDDGDGLLQVAVLYAMGWKVEQSDQRDTGTSDQYQDFIYRTLDQNGKIVEMGMSHWGAVETFYWVTLAPEYIDDIGHAWRLLNSVTHGTGYFPVLTSTYDEDTSICRIYNHDDVFDVNNAVVEFEGRTSVAICKALLAFKEMS